MIKRFFLPEKFSKTIYTIANAEYKHAKVFRLKKKEAITLVNGQGQLAKATVIEVSKTQLQAEVYSIIEEKKPLYTTTLAIGVLKQNHADILTEKATEAGIGALFFFIADRSEKKSIATTRLENIAISALKQSGRLTLPKILLYPNIESIPQKDHILYYGCPESSGKTASPEKNALFYIGPEKGLSEREKTFLQEQLAFPVTLALPVLRAETAGILATYFLEQKKFFSYNR